MAASGRQYTSQTTCRWHPIATGVVRHIEVLKTAGGSESVSTLSRPEWPSWPFSPSAWMQESSELLPATGPRADRGRPNRGETAEYIDLATRGLDPSCLPGISWRLEMQNLAHFAMLSWPGPHHPTPPCPLKRNTTADRGGSTTSQMLLANS